MKIFLQELIVIKNKNLQRFKWRGFYVQYFVRTKNDLGRTLVFLALRYVQQKKRYLKTMLK
jgi:hypothetical protein